MPTINPDFSTKIAKLYDKKVLNSQFLNKMVYTPAMENPAKFAGKMALISALTKDAVGCYYYVTQSLNNDKIPEEKRKFVASLDLMNGILNVALQFTVGMWIDKKVPQWFDKTIGKSLDTDETVKTAKNIHKTIEKMHLPEKMQEADIATFLREKVLGPTGSATKLLKVGFSAAAVLLATQVVTKRVVVPFLSTPLASWYKENFMDKKKPDGQNKDVLVINKTAPQAAQAPQAVPQIDYSKFIANRPQSTTAFNQFAK